MANKEDLGKLQEALEKGDIDIWNKWVQEQSNSGPEFQADLSGADLTGVDLTGANLLLIDLSGANLAGANFGGAGLNWTNLGGANLRGADLTGSNLFRVEVDGAIIDSATKITSEQLLITQQGIDLYLYDKNPPPLEKMIKAVTGRDMEKSTPVTEVGDAKTDGPVQETGGPEVES